MLNWPVVLPNDDGIRPAGKPNECFYCNSKIGEKHAKDCVAVTKIVRYKVKIPSLKIEFYWVNEEPFFWDRYQCEFYHNESSWCSSSLGEFGTFEDDNVRKFLLVTFPDGEGGLDCLCGRIEFEYVGDDGIAKGSAKKET